MDRDEGEGRKIYMKSELVKILIIAAMLIAGTAFAWGGFIYAAGDGSSLRPIGFVVALIGFSLSLQAAFMCQSDNGGKR